MTLLDEQDWLALSACIDRLYACRSLADFPRLACVEIHRMIAADAVVLTYSSQPPSASEADPAVVMDHATASVRFLVMPPPRSADGEPAPKLEDARGAVIAVSVIRPGRAFSDRVRTLIDSALPHLARAFENATAFSQIAAPDSFPLWANDVLHVACLSLDDDLRLRCEATEPRAWLDRFFADAPGSSRCLPPVVAAWLDRHVHASRHDGTAVRGFARERRGERLHLRLLDAARPSAALLVLELDTPRATPSVARHPVLTGREVDVLREVETGMTNIEIAARLGISAQTVRAHLEHIFRKLGVSSRTAAVRHIRTAWPAM